MSKNKTLSDAKSAKNDEFYTQYADIQKEINAYLDYDPDTPQSGHGGLTPYEQAVEYDNARPFDEKARRIVTCNFDEFRIYDRAKPLAPPMRVGLGDLPKEAYRLAFLVNPKEKAIDRELEISVQAGRIEGEIYDALLKQYAGGSQFTATEKADAINCVLPSLRDSKTPSSESKTLRTSREIISQTVQAILDARASHSDCSLADLYDPLTMPPDLRAAHAANDRAVLAAYGSITNGPVFSYGGTPINNGLIRANITLHRQGVNYNRSEVSHLDMAQTNNVWNIVNWGVDE